MNALKKEIRLFIAEKFLSWAWSIAPDGMLKDHVINYFRNHESFGNK